MLQSVRRNVQLNLARFGERDRRRLTGAAFALAIELGLFLAILSLGIGREPPRPKPATVVSMTLAPEAEQKVEKAKAAPAKAAPRLQAERPVRAAPPSANPVPQPTAQPSPALIPMTRNDLAALDISKLPRQPGAAPAGKGTYGPPDLGVPGDSKRVGTAPNGQPMYAAAWYREPYDDELSGYLSTADGPGWALIACRTVPDFRVEDCVGLDEYPGGSNIQRAVLAAAWQFRVRPPRVGGVSQVGSWVRIRIDYTARRP